VFVDCFPAKTTSHSKFKQDLNNPTSGRMGNTVGTTSSDEIESNKEYFVEGIPNEHCIPRVHKISPATFMQKYYLPGKPVILTGMMDDWPAIQVSHNRFFC
jgi:hypothetical protein